MTHHGEQRAWMVFTAPVINPSGYSGLSLWGGRKTFATIHDNHHGDGRQALWIKSNPDAQDNLVEMDPEIFFIPPYVGPSGWIGVRLDGEASWEMIEELLFEGYRSVAPKRALKQLEQD
jgi:hypothetical protein